MAAAPGAVLPAASLSTKVELTVSCKNLIRLDALSKSDPMVVAYLWVSQRNQWQEIGRTEVARDQDNPIFRTAILVDYYFETLQKLKFLVLDVDDAHRIASARDEAALLAASDYIGKVEGVLGEIVSGGLRKEIQNEKQPNRKNGQIVIAALEVSSGQNQRVRLQFAGNHLDKKDLFGKSDPYFVIHRFDPRSNTFVPAHKSEIIKKTLDPRWQEFELSLTQLCNNEPAQPIRIDVWDWDSNTSDDLIGSVTVTLNDLRAKRQFELIEPELARKKKGYKNSGILQIVKLEEYSLSSFLDYVTGGTEISLIVGIDFTGSNGDPRDPGSLHYLNGQYPNEYMAAIRTIGDIVVPYDHDHMIPTFGFGGCLAPTNVTSHCFALNRNENDPNCFGVEGILDAYRKSFSWVQLSGPTNFAPIISKVAAMAQQVDGGERYYILLMITDGVITDLSQTIEAIRRACDLPLSIIIIGVGAADFSSMDKLDDDTGRLFKRDIVQFVPFRKFANTPLEFLAKETLAEVPKQLLQYMNSRRIKPKPRPALPHGVSQPSFYGAPPQQPTPPPPQQTASFYGAPAQPLPAAGSFYGAPQQQQPPQPAGTSFYGAPPPASAAAQPPAAPARGGLAAKLQATQGQQQQQQPPQGSFYGAPPSQQAPYYGQPGQQQPGANYYGAPQGSFYGAPANAPQYPPQGQPYPGQPSYPPPGQQGYPPQQPGYGAPPQQGSFYGAPGQQQPAGNYPQPTYVAQQPSAPPPLPPK